jgi:hypothetical protein
MNLPPLTTILAMYASAVCLLWIATRFLAPDERKPSLLRCFGVAFALTFLGNASLKFLTPLVGDWASLIFFAVYVLLVMGLFRLSFWRSLLVTLIYSVGMFTFYFFFLMRTSE